MKVLYKALIVFIIILSSLMSQSKNLEMPDGNTKVAVLVENMKVDLFTTAEIEAIVKLRLRSNGIKVIPNYNSRDENGLLYVHVNIDIFDYVMYGAIEVSFVRNVVYELGKNDFNQSLNMMQQQLTKGRGPIFNPIVWTDGGILLNTSSRQEKRDAVRRVLHSTVDKFSSAFLDANNL